MMETVISVNLKPEQNLKISLKVLSNFLSHLEAASQTELGNALLNLTRESVAEITRLLNYPNDLILTSLCVRNIFELYLLTRHIYSNPKGLKSWYGQMHKDLEEVRNGFKSLLEKKGLSSPELEDVQEFCNKSLDDSPYTSKGNFNMKSLAIDYGYSEDYDFLYKLASKLVHPSSMRVNSFSSLIDDNNYITVLNHSGAFFSRKLEELVLEIRKNQNA